MIQFGSLRISPVEYGVSANAILGIKSSGKSYTATYFAEQLFDAGIPFVTFDPAGIWRFMRVPGSGHGYHVVIAGGEAADWPLTPATAPEIMRAAMRDGISLILDLHDPKLSKADWRHIVMACTNVLLFENTPFGLRHVFFEEAAEFVPQSVGRDLGQCYAEVEKLVRIGGNSRVGSTLISPRSQEINKAVLELCENMFLHRQRGKNALQNLDKWLDIAGKGEREQIIASLPDLPTGQCWAWLGGGDKVTPPTLVKVPVKNSFHPDRRVLRGEVTVGRKKAVDVGRFIEAMRGNLAKIEEETKANDPAKLRAELATVQRQLAEALASKSKPDHAAIEEAEKRGYARAEASRNQAAAKAAKEQLLVALTGTAKVYDMVSKALVEAQATTQAALREAEAFAPRITAEPYRPAPAPAPSLPAALPPQRKPVDLHTVGSGTLSRTDLRMLGAIAYWNALGIATPSRAQVAFVCRWRPTSGHVGNVAGGLRTRGLIEYPQDGTMALTEEGRRVAPAPAADAVTDSVMAVLDGSQRRVFNVLLSLPTHETSRDELARACSWAPTSGHPGNVFGSMRSLEVITYPAEGRIALANWIASTL